MSKVTGLTLVELMIVVAILSILSAIAYPLFTQQSERARRADAKSALQALALAQERYFTSQGRYGTAAQLDDPDGNGNDSDSLIDPIIARIDSDGDGSADNYAFTVTATTLSFSIEADSIGKQASDTKCDKFWITHLGVRTATDGSGTNCW
jgi:type IV pilus assembly protein PilE